MTNAFFDYGVDEGIPRSRDLFDKHAIKVTSFMISKAIESIPSRFARSSDAATNRAHGTIWTVYYDISREQEKAFITDPSDTIGRITGVQPVGRNAYFIYNSVNISETLQDLGILYSTADPKPR